jgi:hypothetical protein
MLNGLAPKQWADAKARLTNDLFIAAVIETATHDDFHPVGATVSLFPIAGAVAEHREPPM